MVRKNRSFAASPIYHAVSAKTKGTVHSAIFAAYHQIRGEPWSIKRIDLLSMFLSEAYEAPHAAHRILRPSIFGFSDFKIVESIIKSQIPQSQNFFYLLI